jgi:hypothetical protein
MVRRSEPSRAVLRAVLGAYAAISMLLSLGCERASLSAPPSSDPYVFLIISPEPLPSKFVQIADTSLQALLLTAGSASGAPQRHAEVFQLTSPTDGSTFTFLERRMSGEAPGIGRNGADVEDGNYILPFPSHPPARGASELAPLGSYDLRIETGGRIIDGRTRIPDRPQLTVFSDGAKRFVTFPPAAGAAAYLVNGDTELRTRITTANTIELFYDVNPAFVPANPQFNVVALDSNTVRFISDSTRASSGINGGLGLFGSATPARVTVPAP